MPLWLSTLVVSCVGYSRSLEQALRLHCRSKPVADHTRPVTWLYLDHVLDLTLDCRSCASRRARCSRPNTATREQEMRLALQLQSCHDVDTEACFQSDLIAALVADTTCTRADSRFTPNT